MLTCSVFAFYDDELRPKPIYFLIECFLVSRNHFSHQTLHPEEIPTEFGDLTKYISDVLSFMGGTLYTLLSFFKSEFDLNKEEFEHREVCFSKFF